MRIVNMKMVGAPSTPQDIKRHRRMVGDMLRRYGQPVVHRHKYNIDDVDKGIARRCPACWDDAYKNSRNNCTICFGVGFASVEDHPTLYIDDSAELTTNTTSLKAPLWGGFSEPVLTRVMQPDVSIDVFKANAQGIIVRVEESKSYAFWTPDVGDNDLIINVSIAKDGYTLTGVSDFYEAKQVNNHTLRGWGARTRSQNQFTVGQEFEMVLLPRTNILTTVPVGNVEYGVI